MKLITNSNNNISHNTSVRHYRVQYIVIHYTGDSGATGKNEVTYFNRKTTTGASADYFVDFDGTVYQYNNNPAARYCWSVGGGRQTKYGGSMYGKIRNYNSVSIEMCTRKNGSVWTITDQTYLATIELAKSLKAKFNLPSGKVYRHYDVNGKFCPNVENFITPDTRWQEMKAAIDAPTETKTPTKTTKATTGQAMQIVAGRDYRVTTASGLNVRSGAGTNYRIKKAYTKGTIFTALQVYNVSGSVWARTPSGYVCCYNYSAKKWYVEDK